MANGSGQSIHNTYLFLALSISAIVLLTISINTRYFVPIESALRWVSKPIVSIAQLPRTINSAIGFYFTSVEELQNRNIQLQRDLGQFNMNVTELNQARATIKELERALEYSGQHQFNFLLAEVIHVFPNLQRQEVIINVGATAGITVDSGVLDSGGVYGRAIEIFPDSARVLLVSDKRHATPVLVRRTRQYFIASGHGANEPLSLDNVNLSTDIRVGDELVTSGLGGLFPEGYLVGTVETVTDIDSESAKQVTITPTANLSAKSYLHVTIEEPTL